MSLPPIAAVSLEALADATGIRDTMLRTPVAATPHGFAGMLMDGVAAAESKVAQADKLARSFVLDDSIPVHQVTFALEEARMSLELMLQVRSRIIESYQQLMTMQL
ncbi:MAG TPA: flagellar hook-basal body complex protein FliE [Novosphingobium sp.]